MRIALALLFLAIAIRLDGQVPAGTGFERAEATIRGRVLLSDGRPVSRAQLRLTGGLAPVRYAITSDDGSYEFAHLLSGSYRLLASKTGYLSLEFGQRDSADPGQVITVAAGETRARVDIILPRHGAIAGRITDEGGDPIDGARVHVFQIRFAAGRRRLVPVGGAYAVRTNDLGRYRVFGLQPGRYFLRAEAGAVGTGQLPGYGGTYFPGTPNPSEAQVVTVGVSEEVANVDVALTLSRTARVSGVTLDATGEPFQGRILMRPSRRSTSVAVDEVGARTSSDGRFEFPNVEPGEYVIDTARGNDHALQFVSVNGVDLTGLVLQTTAGSTISGRVVFEGGEPLNRRNILLSAVAVDPDLAPFGDDTRTTGVGLDSRFDFSHVVGPRRLHVSQTPTGWALKSILVDGVVATDHVFPFGSSDQSLKNVEVVLTNTITEISGTVADRRTPATQGAVVVFAADRGRWYDESRYLAVAQVRDGRFTVRGLPPDEYLVAAVERLPGAAADKQWQDPEFLMALGGRASRLILNEGEKVSIELSSR